MRHVGSPNGLQVFKAKRHTCCVGIICVRKSLQIQHIGAESKNNSRKRSESGVTGENSDKTKYMDFRSDGAVGLTKGRRKELEHEFSDTCGKAKLSQAVWILWGLRQVAKVPKRMDDLISGYLLRKNVGP